LILTKLAGTPAAAAVAVLKPPWSHPVGHTVTCKTLAGCKTEKLRSVRRGRSGMAANAISVKVTGLAQKLNQLGAVYRDLQSKYLANLNILGRPCNFHAMERHPAVTLNSSSAAEGGIAAPLACRRAPQR
jgi:hypothetical protein